MRKALPSSGFFFSAAGQINLRLMVGFIV